MAKTLKIIELFAGVGGFRVGLEEADKEFFQTVWANQWEPATKIQHAAAVYKERFGHICNEDINTVKTEDIPAHLQSSVFKLSKDLIDSIHEEGIVAYTS